eukprot:998283-Heterocapsa_arctica.AAC.1
MSSPSLARSTFSPVGLTGSATSRSWPSSLLFSACDGSSGSIPHVLHARESTASSPILSR